MDKKTFNINELHLTLYNPRFEIIDKIDFPFIDTFIKSDLNYDIKREINQISKLYNEDSEKYEELFKSILKGFYSVNEKIQLIKNINNNSYIVIEGNRRISCLKIINNWDEYFKILNDLILVKERNILDNEEEIKIKKFFKFLTEYKDDINKLNKSKYKNINENNFTIISNDEDVSNSLYKKHLNAMVIGYKEWNRGKYLFDVWKIFINQNWFKKEDIKQNELLILNRRMNIDENKFFNDYKIACYTIQLINFDNSLTEEEVRNKLVRIKPTSLNRNFVKQTLENIINSIKPNANIKEYYDDEFDYENRKWKNKGSFELNKVFEMINELFDKGLHNTRFNLKKINEMKEIFSKHLKLETIKFSKSDFLEKFILLELNELIGILKDRNEYKFWNKNVENLVRTRISQYKSSEEINEIFKSEEIKTLNELTLQIIHNSGINGTPLFINAIHSGIRTICEYITKIIILKSIESYNEDTKYSQEDIEKFEKIFIRNKKAVIIHPFFKYKQQNEKVEILEALLTDYESDKSKDNNLRKLFKHALVSNDGSIKDLIKTYLDSDIFKDNLKYFLRPGYGYEYFEDFLKNYFLKTNIYIHKTYIKDFDRIIEYYNQSAKESVDILTKFINFINSMDLKKINLFIEQTNEKVYFEETNKDNNKNIDDNQLDEDYEEDASDEI